MAPILKVSDIDFTYEDGNPGLREMTLEIESGSCTVIVGANGSGKSTLLKILNGLQFPQAGTVFYDHHPVTAASLDEEAFHQKFRSQVGFVFQNPDFQLFCPSVREEIAFGPLQMGLSLSETELRVADLLKLFRLTPLAHRAPYHLSGGEKKRVALAAALSVNPKVLLLDEPTLALDPRSKWELVDILLELNGAGKTLVMATHDLEVVEAIGESLIILSEERRVLRRGVPAELLSDTALLEEANLIHAHTHIHRGAKHRHPHLHPHPGRNHHDD